MKSKTPRRKGANLFVLLLLLSLCIGIVRCAEDSGDQDEMDDKMNNGADDWGDDADKGNFQDDAISSQYYNYMNYYVYTATPTKSPSEEPTSKPTRLPTESPTKNPTMQPTEPPDDFYVIEEDDYTYEAQQSRMYVSSFTDVVLCLMCTFFWVIWLVGTIFPNRISHLYKSEGVVVRGDVIDSYQSGGRPSPASESQADDDENQDEGHADTGTHGHEGEQPELEREIDGMNLPTYHAIVSYIVPGRIVRGRKKMTSSYNVGSMGVNSPKSKDTIQMQTVNSPPRSPREANMASLSRQLSLNPAVSATANAANLRRDGTQRIANATSLSTPSLQNTNSCEMASHLATTKNTTTSQQVILPQHQSVNTNSLEIPFRRSPGKPPGKPPNAPALFDDTTRSFDSSLAAEDSPKQQDLNARSAEKMGFYKYNASNTAGDYFYDDSDLDKEELDKSGDVAEVEQWEDDPERIGNFFESVIMNIKWLKNPRSNEEGPPSLQLTPSRRRKRRVEPVRVKKKFETSELLAPGLKNVDIIVLPGNPVSGVIKTEFEEEEEYLLNYQQSEDPTLGMDTTVNNGPQMGDMSAAMIGVVLAAVSTVGAVHSVLTLPYQKRGCELSSSANQVFHESNLLIFLFCTSLVYRWVDSDHYKSIVDVANRYAHV